MKLMMLTVILSGSRLPDGKYVPGCGAMPPSGANSNALGNWPQSSLNPKKFRLSAVAQT